jgi:16S rRNA (uracil1498-N3)-methyltransferase
MKRVLVEDLGGESVVVTGERLHHLARVLRASPGEQLEVFDGMGGCREGVLSSLGPDEGHITLGSWKQTQAAPAITLALGLVKGDKFDWVVQKATELGVGSIVPLALTRSVVRLDGAKAAQRQKRWSKIAEEAARQSGRSDLPSVELPMTLQQLLSSAAARGEAVGLLWEEERAGPGLGAWASSERGPLCLVVGPEGGIDPAEVALAREAGATVLGLGSRVLRAETAAIVSLAVALHRRGELG